MEDEIFNIVERHTNIRIQLVRDTKIGPANRNTFTYSNTNVTELKCLVGCLVMTGVRKDGHLSLDQMFSTRFGANFYRATFSQKRFQFLLRCLRFDDQLMRQNNVLDDKFTHIREIFDKLITNCQNLYTAGPVLTVDEMLAAFYGRVPFKMYIPSKPAKYAVMYPL